GHGVQGAVQGHRPGRAHRRRDRRDRDELAVAGGQERILKRRIRSIESTKKITRAMELIAASRIVRAQQRVAAARPYSEQITEVIRNLAAGGAGLDHPLLRERDESERTGKVGFVAVTADRGLAGAYNANVIRAGEWAIARESSYALFTIGNKARGYFRYRGYAIEHSASGFSEQPRYEDAVAVASEVMRRYEEGELDRVELVYTR